MDEIIVVPLSNKEWSAVRGALWCGSLDDDNREYAARCSQALKKLNLVLNLHYARKNGVDLYAARPGVRDKFIANG